MAGKDPAAVAAKWAARTQAAVSDYTAGVQRVTQAPGRAAAAQADVWAANVASSKAKFARNSAAVDLGTWQAAATGKGAQRIPQGVTDATGKMQAFMTKHLQIVESVRAGLPARGSKEQNIQRAVQMMRGVMQAYGG